MAKVLVTDTHLTNIADAIILITKVISFKLLIPTKLPNIALANNGANKTRIRKQTIPSNKAIFLLIINTLFLAP